MSMRQLGDFVWVEVCRFDFVQLIAHVLQLGGIGCVTLPMFERPLRGLTGPRRLLHSSLGRAVRR